MKRLAHIKGLIIYEDNAINSGKAGFKVYHLFQNGDGTFIFVHRGFIERNLIKNNLPRIDTPVGKKYQRHNAF
ncbi:MAG: hypothetical protein CM15mP31_2130 [Gammaproteobacteria bacterium]|nr:MAG: hypothetical protein CM15mP31_2130 [Gammaproteobacteria bacterium]